MIDLILDFIASFWLAFYYSTLQSVDFNRFNAALINKKMSNACKRIELMDKYKELCHLGAIQSGTSNVPQPGEYR